MNFPNPTRRPAVIVLDIDPVAKGRHRMTHAGRAYTPQKTRQFENQVRSMVRPQWGDEPLSGAVAVAMLFFMRPPVRKVREQPTCKPDIDNLIKAIKDALNGIVWIDDAQVTEITARKLYNWTTRKGRIEIVISETGAMP